MKKGVSSQWEKNAAVLGGYGLGDDGDRKMVKHIEEQNEYYGTQLFRELREQNAIDVVIRHFNPTCNNHERERVNQDDDSDDWDEEDLALLNCEDPDLKNAERERIGQLKRMMDQTVKQVSEDGLIPLVTDKGFLEIANKEPYCVLCFVHHDFFRTYTLLEHLKKIAEKQKSTRFLKVDAAVSHFLVRKLGVQMLPSMYVFMEGKLVDAVVGFDDFGGKDDFSTVRVWHRLQETGVIEDRRGKRRKRAPKTSILL